MIAITVDDARLRLAELQALVKEEDFVKALVALWAISWVRRNVIHEREFQSPLSMLCFINNYLADVALIPETRDKIHHGVVCAQRHKWDPPQ